MRFQDLADGTLLVQYPGLSDEEANARAVSDASALESRKPAGLLEAVVGARTLYLEFDPALTSGRRLEPLLAGSEPAPSGSRRRTLRVPVVYGGEVGADLPELARGAGLSQAEFARRHARASYRVAFLGFAPGFAYMTGVAPELRAPRLATPRTRVAVGAVAIGGPYTGIYPGDTPGGWRLIGRTAVRLFDPDSRPPALFAPGDGVVFEAAGESELSRSRGRMRARSAPRPSGSHLFTLLSPGVFSSVQGAPRYGWSRYGVPPGGAMDFDSLASGNALLGNPPEAAALEMTFVGADLEARSDVSVCFAGAALQAEVNGRPAGIAQPTRLRSGDRVRAGRLTGGARSYLCVEGGLAMPDGPRISARLCSGDVLRSPDSPPAHRGAPSARRSRDPNFPQAQETVVRVVLGPHRSHFSNEGLATFLSVAYRVSSSSDRRGIRLEGTPIGLERPSDIPPEGTPLGGVQVARDGLPIVLGPDRPVTGGYARIATVIGADFPLLARALPGSTLRFRAVDLATALAARVG